MQISCLSDIEINEVDNDYYAPILSWLWAQDSGKYPIKAVAKQITRNKFYQHMRYYERLRASYAERGINLHWSEITFTDDYEYLIIDKK